jgi:hypothetical protein
MKFSQLNLSPQDNIEVDDVDDMGDVLGRYVRDTEAFPFPPNQFEDTQHLLQLLNRELDEKGGDMFRFEERGKDTVHLICNQDANLQLPLQLALMLGDIEDGGQAGNPAARVYPMSAGEEIAFLGRVDIMKYVPHTLLVHCSAVRPSIVGGDYLQLLKVVSLPNHAGVNGKYITIESEHEDYKTLGQMDISNMDFSIRTSSGERAKFVDAVDDHIVMHLHFKRRNRIWKVL